MDVSQGHFLLWKTAKKQKPSLSPFKVVSRTSGAASTFRSVWKTCWCPANIKLLVRKCPNLLVSSGAFMVSSVRERRGHPDA